MATLTTLSEITLLMNKIGVVINQEFKIERNGSIDKNNTYTITAEGLLVKHREKGLWWPGFPSTLRELSEGTACVIQQ